MQTREHAAGFTLVELMVVVLIIGVVAAIALPLMLNTQARALKATCYGNQRALMSAVQTWSASQNTTWLPATQMPDLSPGRLSYPMNTGWGWHSALVPDYLLKAPKCPAWNPATVPASYPDGYYLGWRPSGGSWFVMGDQGFKNDARSWPPQCDGWWIIQDHRAY